VQVLGLFGAVLDSGAGTQRVQSPMAGLRHGIGELVRPDPGPAIPLL
jgi:hypothetical protein